MLTLAQYLAAAALSWMHAAPTFIPNDHPTPAQLEAFQANESESWGSVSARITAVSVEVAELVQAEEPIWADDEDRRRTGLLMMSVAFHEARFRGYVDDGRCNDRKWAASPEGLRLSRLGTCDGGHAVSLWSLHNFRGDRQHAEVEALRRLRGSIRAGHGMRDYTGERGITAPKAAQRMATADTWWRAHSSFEEVQPE